MYVTIYSPGGISVAGNFCATFLNLSQDPPLAIAGETPSEIAGSQLVLHASTYDPASKVYRVPFTIAEGSLDGNHISIGLYLLLGATTENLKLLTVEKEIPEVDLYLLGAAAIILLFLLFR